MNRWAVRGTRALVVASWIAAGCEGPPDSAPVSPATGEAQALRSCSSERALVCGNDGRTYANACLAGGWRHVAHLGACDGFLCKGVVCVAGFHCRTSTIYGVSVDQCVSDSGTPPACSCAAGSHCVQDPSGATRCEVNPPPPPPPDPAAACRTKQCPAGLHCAVITIYGVPAPSCVWD
jgi:hypothetical protein